MKSAFSLIRERAEFFLCCVRIIFLVRKPQKPFGRTIETETSIAALIIGAAKLKTWCGIAGDSFCRAERCRKRKIA